MGNSIVYDKAKYHDETVMNSGLPEERASVHTAFFLGWLIENDLCSDEFEYESSDLINKYKSQDKTAIDVYERWGRCLMGEMLSEEANAFASDYFDFDKGKYISDYSELLVKKLPSEFHVPYTWEKQKIISQRVSRRYIEWKKRNSKRFWEFWK